ncbi:unnamed protein product [Pedinophyceae sp. YPF-701]|nr:unnamed protein product [Pedinophyceae sp. YPF-701]
MALAWVLLCGLLPWARAADLMVGSSKYTVHSIEGRPRIALHTPVLMDRTVEVSCATTRPVTVCLREDTTGPLRDLLGFNDPATTAPKPPREQECQTLQPAHVTDPSASKRTAVTPPAEGKVTFIIRPAADARVWAQADRTAREMAFGEEGVRCKVTHADSISRFRVTATIAAVVVCAVAHDLAQSQGVRVGIIASIILCTAGIAGLVFAFRNSIRLNLTLMSYTGVGALAISFLRVWMFSLLRPLLTSLIGVTPFSDTVYAWNTLLQPLPLCVFLAVLTAATSLAFWFDDSQVRSGSHVPRVCIEWFLRAGAIGALFFALEDALVSVPGAAVCLAAPAIMQALSPVLAAVRVVAGVLARVASALPVVGAAARSAAGAFAAAGSAMWALCARIYAGVAAAHHFTERSLSGSDGSARFSEDDVRPRPRPIRVPSPPPPAVPSQRGRKGRVHILGGPSAPVRTSEDYEDQQSPSLRRWIGFKADVGPSVDSAGPEPPRKNRDAGGGISFRMFWPRTTTDTPQLRTTPTPPRATRVAKDTSGSGKARRAPSRGGASPPSPQPFRDVSPQQGRPRATNRRVSAVRADLEGVPRAGSGAYRRSSTPRTQPPDVTVVGGRFSNEGSDSDDGEEPVGAARPTKAINPLTGRTINVDGPTYNDLVGKGYRLRKDGLMVLR